MIQKKKLMKKSVEEFKKKMKREDHFWKVKLNNIRMVNYLLKSLEQEKFKID